MSKTKKAKKKVKEVKAVLLRLAGIKGQAERKYAAYTFTENDERKIVKFIVAWLNNFYSNQKVIMRGRSVKSYQQDKEKHITDAVLREYTEYIYENNKPSKRIIDFAVQYNVGKKNAQNLVMYLRRYAAEKAVSGYGLSQSEYNILRDELVKSGKQGKEINITDKIYEMALQRYGTVDYQVLIADNPFYVKTLEYLQKSNASYNELQYYLAKRNELIIKEIPENIVDVYPMARNMKRHFIMHVGPTNSGKTYAALNAYKSAVRGVYLAPLRLLAYEVFEQMNNEGVACTMLTGEEEIQVPFSEHYSATVEMADVNMYFDVAVIDECQMCTDRQRGGAWTEAILGIAAKEMHLCTAPSGDINGDSKVNNRDLTALRRYLTGLEITINSAADLNSDGKVNNRDLTKLRRILAGME